MLSQTLLLHFREHAKRLRYRTWLRRIEAAHAQINDIEYIEIEVREIIMNGLGKFLGRARSGPISFRVPPRANLGNDPQLRRIWMQRFSDKLIGDMRP
jgi:hypothetical protein